MLPGDHSILRSTPAKARPDWEESGNYLFVLEVGGCFGKNFAWLHYTTCLFFSAYVSFMLEISICLCFHEKLCCACVCGSCKLGCGSAECEMNGSRVCGSPHRTLLLDPPPCLIAHQWWITSCWAVGTAVLITAITPSSSSSSLNLAVP